MILKTVIIGRRGIVALLELGRPVLMVNSVVMAVAVIQIYMNFVAAVPVGTAMPMKPAVTIKLSIILIHKNAAIMELDRPAIRIKSVATAHVATLITVWTATIQVIPANQDATLKTVRLVMVRVIA